MEFLYSTGTRLINFSKLHKLGEKVINGIPFNDLSRLLKTKMEIFGLGHTSLVF